MTESKAIDWNRVLETNSPALDSGEHLALLWDWLKIAGAVTLWMMVFAALTFLGATWGWALPIVGAFLCAFVVGCAMFNITMDGLRQARSVIALRNSSWEDDKVAMRDLSFSALRALEPLRFLAAMSRSAGRRRIRH